MNRPKQETTELNNIQLELKNDRGVVNGDVNTPSEKSKLENENETQETGCGLGSCRPGCLQCCAGILSFSIVLGLGQLLNQALPSYLTSQITFLEKQYNINSSLAGFVVSCNDIGYALAVLFFSHFCKRTHIPRLLGICMIIFGIATIFTVVPHFITMKDMLDYTNVNTANFTMLCIPQYTAVPSVSGCGSETDSTGNLTWVVAVICIALLLQGTGASPRGTLGTLYIDNNIAKKKTGFFVGIVTTVGLLGPFIALILGGVVAMIPVDLKETAITPIDQRWIGAWWIGYLVFGVPSLIIAVLYICFPRKLKRKEKDEEYVETQEENLSAKELVKSLKRIFSNLVNVFNLISAMTALLSVAVLSSFGPKYFEVQFNIPTAEANLILGVQSIITACVGTFLGGYLVMRLKLDRDGCLKMIVILHVIWCIFKGLQYIFGCDNHVIHNQDLSSPLPCGCDYVPYLALCGSDGRTYHSPCHAGCSNVTTDYVFGGCLLINNGTGHAKPGICDSGCNNFIPFVATNVGHLFVGTMAVTPVIVAFLRSVEAKDRAMTLGIANFVISITVYIAGPILTGMLFDSTCKIWRLTSCGERGACALYDVVDIRLRLISADFGLNVITTILNAFALIAGIHQTRKLMKTSKGNLNDKIDEQNKTNEAYVNSSYL